jgi:predicted TIM-barrel fold metal-dependent hydrolase
MTSIPDPLRGAEVCISADSHVAEPLDIWEKYFPIGLRERAPKVATMPTTSHTRAGGWDPDQRLRDCSIDHITAEALYPSMGARMYKEKDVEMAHAFSTAYNDWLIEYCQYAPDRLWGLCGVPLWDVDFALKEMERSRKAGLVGVDIWMKPPEDLPFSSPHYERFWAKAEELAMPVAMHINQGFVGRPAVSGTIEGVAARVHGDSQMAKEAFIHIILSGVLERYPRLKVIVGEVNWGWVPFWLQELDENYQRYKHRAEGNLATLPLLPSEYFERQCYSTFIDDTVGCYVGAHWWHKTAMFSTDYPHWNGIWPKGTETLNRTLGPLSPEQRYDVVCGNVARLYGKEVPALLPKSDLEVSREEWPARLQREAVRNL